MVRRIVFCLLFVMSCMGTQLVLGQQVQEDVAQKSEVEQPAISVTVTGNTIRIQNAYPGAQLEVYNVLGIKVQVLKLDAADKTFTLNLSKGCYILKIENVVRKIAIK